MTSERLNESVDEHTPSSSSPSSSRYITDIKRATKIDNTTPVPTEPTLDRQAEAVGMISRKIDKPHGNHSRVRLYATIAAMFSFVGVVGGISFLIGQSYNASLTDQQQAQNISEAGTVRLSIDEGSAQATTQITDIFPGESRSVYMNVLNDGSLRFGKLENKLDTTGSLADKPAPTRTYETIKDGKAITVTGRGGSPLNVTVESCMQAWSNGECTGGTAEITTRPTSSNVPFFVMKNGSSLEPNSSVYLKMTYALPETSGPEYEGTSATFTYTFIATQRDGQLGANQR